MNTPSFQDISIDLLRPSPGNQRKRFKEAELIELAESIKQIGIAQPILVRPMIDRGQAYFEIVAGERRFRASKLAEKSTVPAMVRSLSDAEALELQVIENLQRADLHPLEEAEGYEQLMKMHGFSAEQLAAKVGKSKGYVYTRLKLLDLVPEARQAFYDDKLTSSTALLVARIPVKSLQAKAVKEITTGRYGNEAMSAREATRHIHDNYMLQLKQAPFKTNDATLCPSAGACGDCPKRTGNQPELFTDVESVDVCTDPTCFNDKRTAHNERLKVVAQEKGQKVISGAEAKKIKPNSYGLNGGFVSLDDTCWDDPKHRTYRKILGKDKQDVVLLENPHKAEVIEIVKKSAIEDTLAGKGIVSRDSVSAEAKEEGKKRAEKARIEKEFRQRLLAAIRENRTPGIPVDVLRNVIAILLRASSSREAFLKLYGWDKEVGELYKGTAALDAATANFSEEQLQRAVIDLTLADELAVNEYSLDKKPVRMLAAAERAGINPDAIKAIVKMEAKAKTATKAAKAPKKVPAEQPAEAEPTKAATKKTTTTKAAVSKEKAAPKKSGRASAAEAKPSDDAPSNVGPVVTLKPEAAWPFPGDARRRA